MENYEIITKDFTSEQKIEYLSKKIEELRNSYYNGEDNEVSDQYYDFLEEQLRSLDPNNELLNKVGVTGGKVRHNYPTLSLEKVNREEDLLKWVDKENVICSWKVDGSNLTLRYTQGDFYKAVSRGDGEYGEDLTSMAYFVDFPKNIPETSDIEINGEVCIKKDDFVLLCKEMKERGLEVPSSMRNIVSGLLHRKDHKDLCSFLSFKAYKINGLKFNTEYRVFLSLHNWQFETPFLDFLRPEDISKMIKDYSNTIENQDYLVDGLVFAINDMESQLKRGETRHHPKGKMAFKFKSESKIVKIQKITYDVCRTGVVSFVGHFEPVELSGAMVGKCTLHNISYIKTHNINEGCEIEITRSNEVIPKHLRTVSENGSYEAPNLCPLCFSQLILTDSGKNLKCMSEDCYGKKISSLCHFVESLNIMNLNEKTIEKLYSLDLLKEFTDFYNLIDKKFFLEGLAEKGISRLKSSLKTAFENIDLKKFIVAMGKPNIGEKIAEIIVNVLGDRDFSEFDDEDLNEVINTKGIGSVIKSSILLYLPAIRSEYDKFVAKGVSFKSSKREVNADKKVFVITGDLSLPRKQIYDMIKNKGHEVKESINKDVNYLVCNKESSSSKYKKALSLNIPVITEDDLLKMLDLKEEPEQTGLFSM